MAARIMLRAALALTLAAGGASAQFGAFTWTLVAPQGGTGSISGGTMHVEGPSQGFCDNELTYFETTAPYDGVVRVFLDYTTFDICHYDYPIHVVNGVATSILPWGSSGNCWLPGQQQIEFEVAAGDTFGLGVGSVDCFEGPGVADFTAFSFLPPDWQEVGPGLDPRVLAWVPSPLTAGGLGASMVSVGDANGDGVDDVVVSNPTASTRQVQLHSGADASVLWTHFGDVLTGSSLAPCGDVDGDGVIDVAAGRYVQSTVRVLSGATGAVLWSWTWSGPALDYYGGSLAAPTDLDGDGTTDLAVGSSKTGPYAIRLVSGADGSDIGSIAPGVGDTSFGRSLAAPGDLTGDGIGELAFVAEDAATTRVVVLSGADLGEVVSFVPPGVLGPSFNWTGSLGSVADRDGDGLRDLLVATPSYDDGPVTPTGPAGLVSVHSVFTGQQLASFGGGDPGADFGSVAVEGPDLTGDGVPELAVGAPDHPGLNLIGAGRVDVLDGATGSLLQRLDGRPGEQLGSSLAWVTGAPETLLMVGAPSNPPTPQQGPGAVFLFDDLDHLVGAPALIATGKLVPGATYQFRISRGLPNALVGWVLGLTEVGVGFKGGVLTPAPDVILILSLPPSGKLVVAGTWPGGSILPPSLVMQVWLVDAAGPLGFSATPAFRRDD